jgi:DNA helicase-2/ATP-dependent DNA helicase PcrA
LTEPNHALQSAYFARVDIQEEDGKIVPYYVSKHGPLSEVNVFSWAAPKPAEWYYNDSEEVLLKRSFVIEADKLKTIDDLYIHPSQKDTSLSNQFGDVILQKFLRENKTGELHDIVATIQAQQYRIIQSPSDNILGYCQVV